MGSSEELRNLMFWLSDRAKGGLIAEHYRDIRSIMENPGAARDWSAAGFRTLLKHASSHTNYYRHFRKADRLEDLPVVQKSTIRNHYDDFVSEQHDRADLVKVTTSGSYGTPFTFHLTKQKKARQLAEIIYFSKWASYTVGMRHAYVRVTKVKGPLKLWLQNEVLMDPTHLDSAWLERQREQLIGFDIKVLIGYPSAIHALAEHCQVQRDHPGMFSLMGIITSAEPLHESVRERIRKIFGCDVLSRYSTEEFGVLAHECRSDKRHHINIASYIVELLALDSDRPVARGEIGRVVVTDLYSHAMPLIRYDTGDLAIAGDGCPCGLGVPTLESLEGRKVESVYNSDGCRVSPFSINGAMRDLDGVVQFQFVQEDRREYTIKLCVLPSFGQESTVKDRFHRILGDSIELRVEYVESIPALRSGKRPYIINRFQS